MQTQHSTRFDPSGHERPLFYRIGRAGFEHPRELRLPMAFPPLLQHRPLRSIHPGIYAHRLPSGLPVLSVVPNEGWDA